MDLDLKDKKAVILGGTRGIGRAIAETLVQEGADIALCARQAEPLAETIAEFRAKGATACGRAVDITQSEALKDWIASAAEELGGIDILVSNAGAMAQGHDAAAWRRNFELDVLGAVSAFEAAEPFLARSAERHGSSAFIIIASISAAIADQASAYGPVKASLIHMAKGLARQYAGQGIRTNVVSPGMVYFEGGVWHQLEQNMPDFFKKAVSRNPMRRCATPQEVAHAAVFLASPLSSYTTGINLIVDGVLSNRVNF